MSALGTAPVHRSTSAAEPLNVPHFPASASRVQRVSPEAVESVQLSDLCI